MENMTESSDALNLRFADALLPWTITLGLFTLVGITGNISVLLTFTVGWRYRNNTFRIFCIIFAIIDLITCSLVFPSEMVKHRHFFSFESTALCKLKCTLNSWAGSAASLTLLIICIDRYKKICRPLSRQMSPQLAVKLCIGLSFAVPCILSIPAGVMCGIKVFNKTNIYNTTTTAFRCETEQRYERSIYRIVYKFMLLFVFAAMSLSCVVMYCLIGRILLRQWRSAGPSFKIKASFRRGDSLTSESTDCTMSSTAESTIHAVTIRPEDASKVTSIIKQQSVDSDTGPQTKEANNAMVVPGKEEADKDPSTEQPLLNKSGESVPSKGKHHSLTKQNSIVEACLNAETKKPSRSQSFTFNKNNRFLRRQSSGFGLSKFPYKTLIWFILTLVFIITYLTFLTMTTKVAKMFLVGPRQFAGQMALYRLYYINNIINAIVYYLFDENSRRSFLRIVPNLRTRIRRSLQ